MKIYYKLGLTFVLFSVISYINALAAINIRNPLTDLKPLPDIGFKYLPQISSYYPNILLTVFCIYFFVRYVRKKNLQIINSLILSIALLFLLRVITFTVTYVPPATNNCYRRGQNDMIEWNVVKYLVLRNDNTCLDYMFSGHVVYFVLLYLTMLKISDTTVGEKIFFSIYITFGILSIISSHIHYSVDVVIAIIFSFVTFYNLILTA